MRPHRWQPTRLPHSWDSPGKNTGVGCHFFLQCVKVKSESEVSQLCLTCSDPMDCSLPGPSFHGIFCARVLEWLAIAFSILFSICSVQFIHSVMSDSLRPHELQQARPPCPSPTSGVHSNSRLSSRWCHPAISSSVILFSSCPQSLPASESFPMSQLFTWGGQSTGVSALASFLPKNTQDWSPLEWTGWISYILLKKNKKKKKQLALLYWRLRELLLNENRNTSLHGCNKVPKTRAILW